MGPLLEKLSHNEKEIILKGDFNMNILNFDSDKDTADFTDTIYSSLLYPTMNSNLGGKPGGGKGEGWILYSPIGFSLITQKR